MTDDYEVGYKRPPMNTRFRKGQTGNPHGRPKGARNIKTDLAEELGERIGITVQGSHRKITKQRALIKAQVANAIKGDPRAAALVWNMSCRMFHPEDTTQEIANQSPEDAAIVEAFLQQRSRANGGSS
jgi:hypothetical protein